MKEVIKHLKNGGVIAYPTETLWGLGADISNDKAVERIFEIKGRETTKAMSVLVRNSEQAKEIADFSEKAEILAKTFWPGPLTLVLPKKDLVSDLVTGGSLLVGLRCSPHSFVEELFQDWAKPLITTSVNRSGEEPARKRDELNWLPEDVMIIDGQCNLESKGSTVIKIENNQITILREGDLPKRLLEQ